MALTKVPHGLSAHTSIVDGASSTAITIDASGNVGIGGTPTAKFHLKGSANTYAGGLRIEGTDETTALAITHINGDNFFSGNATDDHLVLTGSGSLGIGTTSATARLEVKGAFGYASGANSLSTTVSKAAARIRGSSDASTSLFFGSLTNDAEQYIQSSNGDGTGADDIALNPFGGNVGVGTTSPDVLLHVDSGAAGSVFKVETSSGQHTVEGSDASGTYIEQTGTTAATRKFRLQNQDGSNNYTQVIIDGANRRVEVVPGLDVHQGAVWSETAQGAGKGTIHLDPAIGTDHAGSSITFGASDTGNGQNAQAGIYIRSDGSYGTKMYIATTNSYAAGSKTAMSIDHLGNVNFPRGHVRSQVPAFNAHYSANGYTAATGAVFAHNTVRYNNGGHFNTTNYRFTAPVAGVYHFHFHTIYYGSGSNAHISIRVNGSGYPGTNTHYSSNNGAVWQTINITTNLDLAENDYVDVMSNSLGGMTMLHGGVWNEFSGYLVG